MRNDQRVLINTLALYGKIIINIVISLYLTRIVLNALGVNDYGIYNLIAGTIAFLSFLNSALSSSAQRYFSVLKGKNDIEILKIYFTSNVIIHLFLCIGFIVIFEVAYIFLFDGFFNIDPHRVKEAKIVYQLTCLSMIVTVFGVPYASIINANEDLVFFAIVESVCAILKLGVIWLFRIPDINLLVTYTAWIVLITILGVALRFLWCKRRYPECRHITLRYDKKVGSKMLSFSSWNALGSFAMMCRSQGVALVINVFWGTAINAVYGIANQVNGQLSYFSQMLTASFAPQIMKSVGENNFEKLRFLSMFSSKISFFMSAVFAIPLIIEIDFILKLWLKDVPLYTNIFCALVIYVFLIMQLYPGVVRAILAVGKIHFYQTVISILMILTIIGGIIIYKHGFESYSICYIMIVIQLLSLFATIYFANKYYSLSYNVFYKFFFLAIIGFIIILEIMQVLDSRVFFHINPFLKFVINTIISMILFSVYYYNIVLDQTEKYRLKKLIFK